MISRRGVSAPANARRTRFVRAPAAIMHGQATLAGYWEHVTTFAIFMLATLGLRLHEVIPYLHLLHPAAVIGYGGIAVLFLRTSAQVMQKALGDRFVRLLAAYVFWAMVTAPFALWPALAINSIQSGPPTAIMALAIVACPPTKRNANRLTWWYCLGAGLLAVETLAAGVYVIEGTGARLSHPGSFDPNDLAAVMAMAFPLSLGFMTRERGLRRIAALVSAGLCAYIVVRTGSRGGALALVVGSVVLAVAMRGTRRIVAITLLVLGPAVAWQFGPETFRARIRTMTTIEQDYNYTAYSGRKQIWARGRGYVLDHPIAGVGAGNFPIAEGDFSAALNRPSAWMTAHNAYLQAFAELGLVGGSLFVGMLIVALRRAWPMWLSRSGASPEDHRPEYLAALLAFMASAYFLSHAYFYPLYALLAVIALAHHASQVQPGASPARAPTRVAGWRSNQSRQPIPQANG